MVDHYTKMLRQHHAREMAKGKPLLCRGWTPVAPSAGEGSGTLVHRIVKWRSELLFPGSSMGSRVAPNHPRPVQKLGRDVTARRSEEHTSELQSPYVISYAVFCLKK